MSRRRRCRCRYGYRPGRRIASYPRTMLSVAVLGLAVVMGGGLLLGSILPERVEVVETATLPASPELVWQLLADLDNHPSWRRGVTRVERLPDSRGRVVWREYHGDRLLSLRATAMVPAARFSAVGENVAAERNLEWSWEIRPRGGYSEVVLRLADNYTGRLDRATGWLLQATRREARGWLKDLSVQVALTAGHTTTALGKVSQGR